MDIVFSNRKHPPKNCAFCFAMHSIPKSSGGYRCLCYAVNDVCEHDNTIGDYTEMSLGRGEVETPPWCPMKVLEDHGRLIDADKLPLYDELFMNGKNDSGVWVRYRDVERVLKEAPTVLDRTEYIDDTLTERDKALRLLQKCGILDEKNQLKGPYKDIFVWKDEE